MIPILFKRIRTVEYDYHLSFDRIDEPDSGYWFDCDAAGFIDETKLTPLQKSSWDDAQNRELYQPARLVRTSRNFIRDAIGNCYCGKDVTLPGICICGKEYNQVGQELIPKYGRMDCKLDGMAFDENDL